MHEADGVGVLDTNAARVLARWAGRPLGRAEAQAAADDATCNDSDDDCDGDTDEDYVVVATTCGRGSAGARDGADPRSAAARSRSRSGGSSTRITLRR